MDPSAPELWGKVISAAVVPVVMISACGLLCLAFYNRLTAVLVRIRAFQSEALKEQEELIQRPRTGETERLVRKLTRDAVAVLERQMDQLMNRARLIRRTLYALLSAIACLVLCSCAAGAGALWPQAFYVAAPLFLAGEASMLAAVIAAMLELRVSLEPVEVGREFVERLGQSLPPELESPLDGES